MESKRYILLVDDEQNITNALKRELRDWTTERSLEIVTAQSAMQGLAILEQKASETVLVVSHFNAGHNHPFVLRGNKAVELPVSGSALGFAAKVSYAEKVINVIKGDVLILHTDGLAHAGLATEFDPLRLEPILNALPYGADYHRRLLEAALAATKAKDFTDDVTILTAKVL